ncbi:unnamed protein product [Durusdinium trenchii]|uniref:Uncharacterized protein n=1 Tax=Durusdinium trenchii TaxID=1381693 RepID=A0ABP0M4T4_9DINO
MATEHFVELFKELQQENGGRAPTAKQLAQTCDISMDTAKEILAELKEIVPPPPKRARKVAEKKPESAESLAEKPVQEETQEPAGKPSSGTPAEAKSPMAVETPTPPSAVVAVDEETQLDAFEQHVEQLFTEPTAGQRMKQSIATLLRGQQMVRGKSTVEIDLASQDEETPMYRELGP